MRDAPTRAIVISIHAPRTGSDRSQRMHLQAAGDFNPRSPHGERQTGTRPAERRNNFNPRSPHGERRVFLRRAPQLLYFNPRSPHGERRARDFGHLDFDAISIHAPRTGSDLHQGFGDTAQHISIHAPRTGSDIGAHGRGFHAVQFQSTLPARGATAGSSSFRRASLNFNPRSPHGERRARFACRPRGSDFNPRSPHGERREKKTGWVPAETISIHAPRTGSDNQAPGAPRRNGDFNPRSPHGERQQSRQRPASRQQFQSTLPARGATAGSAGGGDSTPISIHAPRTGSDDGRRRTSAATKDFNPRSPHGERPLQAAAFQRRHYFNPRSPHGERPACKVFATVSS